VQAPTPSQRSKIVEQYKRFEETIACNAEIKSGYKDFLKENWNEALFSNVYDKNSEKQLLLTLYRLQIISQYKKDLTEFLEGGDILQIEKHKELISLILKKK
jgi:hypothetical protein